MTERYLLSVGDEELSDYVDLNDGSTFVVRPGTFKAPPPLLREYHSRSRETEQVLDTSRTVELDLSIHAADPVILWSNYRRLEYYLLLATRAWGPRGTGTTVCLRAQPVGGNEFVFLDIFDGQIITLAEDYGASPHVVVRLSLLALPYARGRRLTLPTQTGISLGSAVHFTGIPGDGPALPHLMITDTSTGSTAIAGVRVGARSHHELAAGEAPFVLAPDTTRQPGTQHLTPYFFGALTSGDATAWGTNYVRKTPTADWQAHAMFDLPALASTLPPGKREGMFDCYLRVRSPNPSGGMSGGGGSSNQVFTGAALNTPVTGVAASLLSGTPAAAGFHSIVVTPLQNGVEFPYYSQIVQVRPSTDWVANTGSHYLQIGWSAMPLLNATAFRLYIQHADGGGSTHYPWMQSTTPADLTGNPITTVYFRENTNGPQLSVGGNFLTEGAWFYSTAPPFPQPFSTYSTPINNEPPSGGGVVNTIPTPVYKADLRLKVGIQPLDNTDGDTIPTLAGLTVYDAVMLADGVNGDWRFQYAGTVTLAPVPRWEDGTVPAWLIVLETMTGLITPVAIDVDSLWLVPHDEPQTEAFIPSGSAPSLGVWQFETRKDNRQSCLILDAATGALVSAPIPFGQFTIGPGHADLYLLADKGAGACDLVHTRFDITLEVTPRYIYLTGNP